MLRNVVNKAVPGVSRPTNPLARLELDAVRLTSGCGIPWVENPQQAVELCNRRKTNAIVLELPCSLNFRYSRSHEWQVSTAPASSGWGINE
jgi:hypothetical protein